MRYYYLILILSYYTIHVNGQQETTTTLYTSFPNMTRTLEVNTPTIIPTATVATLSNSMNMTLNGTSSATTSNFFSPSPTSFVFTHFPVFPIHTGSSSSMMSSARPSQSAPFPDDTIGKYGRLHISNAANHLPFLYPLTTFLLTVLYFLK